MDEPRNKDGETIADLQFLRSLYHNAMVEAIGVAKAHMEEVKRAEWKLNHFPLVEPQIQKEKKK